ncbi:hypothetical protein L873DRAFT_1845859 [Choiromyces venosus 120613-1]|uniref:Uncharacterized protein n=1 Tax=Choiromyces venosus 120613-1 TaxID=1336337 RepID=A0A3N4JED9_9PEZI|nr:hypothetical protein L873DRAFT_1845859 [Choiromyces venosus 120613-1]
MAVTRQRDGGNNLRIIGDEVIGLETKFAVLEQSREVLREEMGQLRGRFEKGFTEIKGMLMSPEGSGGLRVRGGQQQPSLYCFPRAGSAREQIGSSWLEPGFVSRHRISLAEQENLFRY